ncbi:pentatricopeptide repeat-containing protein At5g39350 [Aristolochia californica]|uniref:pentatricopeptide repeat-containing protein At5g39350 n=1 Tax=Aristolochia californica TaxID=171875 RepID=UPI0035E26113
MPSGYGRMGWIHPILNRVLMLLKLLIPSFCCWYNNRRSSPEDLLTTMNLSSHVFPKIKRPLHHLSVDASVSELLLKTCLKTRCLRKGKQLHAYMIACGLLGQSPLLCSKLVAMYAICGGIAHARFLFDGDESSIMKNKSAFLWNVMIRGYVNDGAAETALSLYDEMLSSGQKPDNLTFPFLLKACGDLSLLQVGKQIHAQAIATGYGSDTYVQNSLIAMYMNCDRRDNASLLFANMHERDVVSWNTMIAGNLQHGCLEEALAVFVQMQRVGEQPDSATVVSVLPIYAHSEDLRRVKQVHGFINIKGFGNWLQVRNSLIDTYAKCGSMEDASKVFDDGEKDVVSWTTMIGGYVLNKNPGEAFLITRQMLQLLEIKLTSVTLTTLLSACPHCSSSLEYGKSIHGIAIRKYGQLQMDVIVETALIDLYAKCGQMDLCYRVFTNTTRRKTVPWNAVISGYTHNGLAREAILVFKQMRTEAVPCNTSTIICLLPAYGSLANHWEVRNIHGYLVRSGFIFSQRSGVEITTGLMHIYSKSGNLDSANMLFATLPKKDIVSWGAIISGYGMHGYGKDAILLFNQMIQSGIKPNEVTLTSVLYACSHAGLVDDGICLFRSMTEIYHIEPHLDHYCCIVDLLGRAGRLKEAYDIIATMPLEPNQAVWGALLGACALHKNVDWGEVAAKYLFELVPDNTGNYVLLGNIYSAVGMWNHVEGVRTLMNDRGLSKTPGYSLLEVRKPFSVAYCT